MRLFIFNRLILLFLFSLFTGRVLAQDPSKPRNPANQFIVEETGGQSQSDQSAIRFSVGLGFNALSVMGPSAHVGISYKMLSLELAYVFGIDKAENVTLALKNSSSLTETYDYSCSKFWVRLGYNFGKEKFVVSPQVGASFNMISGKSVSGVSNSSDYFMDSNPMSMFAAVRLSYEVVDNLRIHLTPQYDFSIGGDEIFEVIKQGDSKIKNWADGFGVNVGIIYEF